MSSFETPFNDPYLSFLFHQPNNSHQPDTTTNTTRRTSPSFPSSSPVLPSLYPSTLSRRVSSSSISPGVNPNSNVARLSPTQSLYSLSHPPHHHSSPPAPSSVRMSPPDLVASTPSSVTRFLILSAPLARAARAAAEVLLWRDQEGKAKGIAVLAGWWAVCLLGRGILRWALPPFLFFLYFYPTLPTISDFLTSIFSPHTAPSSPSALIVSLSADPARPLSETSLQVEPATSQTLAQTISDYSALHSLISQAWPGWIGDLRGLDEEVGRKRLLRALAGTWLVWIIGGWVFGVRVMVGSIGTAILLLPSPYLPPLISALQSSRTINRLFSLLTLAILGPRDESAPISVIDLDHPRPSLLSSLFTRRPSGPAPTGRGRSGSIKTLLDLGGEVVDDVKEEKKEEDVKREWEEEPLLYRFELMENQRWWLALDWTSTLAPGDRPLWCDTYLHPTPSPSQYSLPSSSKIVVPSTTHPGYQEERTTFWSWADGDWAVLRNFHPEVGQGLGGAGQSSGGTGSSGGAGGVGGGVGRGFTTFVPNKTMSSSGSMGGGTDPSPLLPATSSSSATSGALSPSSTATTFQSRMSLGEAALSKGLERLKAATSSHASPSPSPLPPASSADPSSPTSPIKRHSSSSMMAGSASSHGGEGETQKTLWAGAGMMSAGSGAGTAFDGTVVGGAIGSGLDKEIDDLDAMTDEMGWSYGGNKWESLSSKGGLGKFTRRRRWVRKATLVESIRLIPIPLPSPPPLPNPSIPMSDPKPTDPTMTTSNSSSRPLSRASSISRKASGLHPARGGSVGGVETISAESSSGGYAVAGGGVGEMSRGSLSESTTTEMLRQRLKKVVAGGEGAHHDGL